MAFGSTINRWAASHAQRKMLEIVKLQASNNDKEKLINSINLYIYSVVWKQMNRPKLTHLILDSLFEDKNG